MACIKWKVNKKNIFKQMFTTQNYNDINIGILNNITLETIGQHKEPR